MEVPQKFIIFDTEFTSWEGAMARQWTGTGEHRELVQIGAIKVDDWEEIGAFSVLIRPAVNPRLSDYFVSLTNIEQAQVDEQGVSFAVAQQQFFDWCGGLPLCSFTGEDQEVFKENAELYHEPYLFAKSEVMNACAYLNEKGVDTNGYTSGTIPAAVGLTPPPNAHNALNDARSIFMTFKAVYTTQ